MKKLLFTIIAIAGLTVTSLTQADEGAVAPAVGLSGSIGLSSDYFYRGISQNNHSVAPSLNLAVESNGWYIGTWVSPVDFGTDTQYEYDLYGGYDKQLTDKLTVGGGFLQYNYDTGIEKMTELYVKGSYADIISIGYYVDKDNSDNTYYDVAVKVPYISVVDLHLNYGKFKDGEDHKGVTVSKDVGNGVVLSLMAMSMARHGKFMDSAALGIHYNF
jgi:uncharacterized protein (TIGR02001 family)